MNNVDELRLDEQATVQQVKQLLDNYPHFKNIARRLDDPEYINHGDNGLLQPIEASQLEAKCRLTIESLQNAQYRLILHDRYLCDNNTDKVVKLSMNLTDTTYNRYKRKACLAFAELSNNQVFS